MNWTEFMKKYLYEAGNKAAWKEFVPNRGYDVQSISRAVIQP